MGKGWWAKYGGMHVAASITYAVAYLAIRPYSDPHWALTSGFRLACLLLVPCRYWPALVVGEAVPLAYSVFHCESQFGLPWALVSTFPPIMTAMPIVWFCRERLGLFPARRIVDMKVLLTCTLSASLVWALVSYAAILVAIVPADSPVQVTPLMVVGMLVGNYVAALTMLAWPVFIRISDNGGPWRERMRRALGSALCLDALLVLAPSLALISWMSDHSNGDAAQILQMFMFLPLAWLTMKYGWRGVAAGAPLVVASICLLTEGDTPDPVMIRTQAFVAVAITCLFVLGARITSQLFDEQRGRDAMRNALRVAQQCLQIGENRLRQTSQALEMVGGTVAITHSHMVQRVRHLLPHDEGQSLSRQATTTRNQLFRLAESLHPVAWRERGLPAALRETIGRALDEAGIAYRCLVEGRGLSQLALALHQVIYRLACEAVVYVSMEHRSCNLIRLTLRGGETHGRRWAVLRVEGAIDPGNETAGYAKHERQGLPAKLGVNVVDLEALKNQASLFNGLVHVKTGETFMLTLLFHDAHSQAPQSVAEARPARLWVR